MEENVEISLVEPDNNIQTLPVEPAKVVDAVEINDNVENTELVEKIKEYESKVSKLHQEINSKTDVIQILENQKSSFEKEVTNVKL